jgi:hypothetical protein
VSRAIRLEPVRAGIDVSRRTRASRSRCDAAGRRARARAARPGCARAAGPVPRGAPPRRPPPCCGVRGSGADRVRRRAQPVSGDVRHRDGLAGRERRVLDGCGLVAAGGVGDEGGGVGGLHGDVAADPGAGDVEGVPGSGVVGSCAFEDRQDVLGAVDGPPGDLVVVLVGEGASASDRDEAGVSFGGQDRHGAMLPRPGVGAPALGACGPGRGAGGRSRSGGPRVGRRTVRTSPFVVRPGGAGASPPGRDPRAVSSARWVRSPGSGGSWRAGRSRGGAHGPVHPF